MTSLGTSSMLRHPACRHACQLSRSLVFLPLVIAAFQNSLGHADLSPASSHPFCSFSSAVLPTPDDPHLRTATMPQAPPAAHLKAPSENNSQSSQLALDEQPAVREPMGMSSPTLSFLAFFRPSETELTSLSSCRSTETSPRRTTTPASRWRAQWHVPRPLLLLRPLPVPLRFLHHLEGTSRN